MTLNDLEPPKNELLVNFCNFWIQRTFQHWIATKWLEIDQDNLRMKFSALNVDFSSPSFNHLCSRRPAQAGVKYGYFLKKWLFYHNYINNNKVDLYTAFKSRSHSAPIIILCSMKMVADRHRYAACGDKLFIGVNVDDLEWPWTPKIGVFSNFLWFLAATHILRVNCAEMAGDGPGQPVYDIFSIGCTFLRI